MKPESHNEIYRVAFDVATSELTEITAEFERLLLRKQQVERLISVLKPVIGEDEDEKSALETVAAQSAAHIIEASVSGASEPIPEPAGVVTDPFQRRVDHVLGIGAGIRDVRQYTRQF